MTRIFQTPIRVTLKNFKTGELYSMQSIDNLELISDDDLERIVTICNQELPFKYIFSEMLDGKQYTKVDAQRFVQWIIKGWVDQSHFVFLIRDPKESVVAAVDIKSNDLERAEIGYWADMYFPGIMTAAVSSLVNLAESAGYKELYAYTVPENTRSQNVLYRNGFDRMGDFMKPSGLRWTFVRSM